ncbi:M56 family metallopeptidase [Verrucomicrobium sp. BvORR106]|uniref:M56 family metallopeptidase n=1 Tax=Verrucomicrobium sp. BvORR106 TaxID=1403819 RepID=UPI0005705C56|nr:M56 family metallopeptidase [Verrucomicrobium sp. BvORR106]
MNTVLWWNLALHLLAFTAMGWVLVRWFLRDARFRAWTVLASISLGMISPWIGPRLPIALPKPAVTNADSPAVSSQGTWKIQVTTTTSPAIPSSSPPLQPTTLPSRNWTLADGMKLLSMLWVAGAALGLAGHLMSTLQALSWQRRLRRPDAAEWKTLPKGANTFPIRLFKGKGSPCVAGWWHPVIAIPEGSMRDWSAAQWNWVLRHEEQHRLGGDTMMAAILGLLRAIFWWNPFLHALTLQWAQAREEICDHAALQFPGEASDYADLLLTVAAQSVAAPLPMASSAMATSRPARHLRARIHALLKGHPVSVRTSRWFMGGYSLVAAGLMVLLAQIGFAEPLSQGKTAAATPKSTTPNDAKPGDAKLQIRTYRVRPDFMTAREDFKGKTAKEILEFLGISFPEGGSAVFIPKSSMLIVKSTTAELDHVDRLLDQLSAHAPLQVLLEARWIELLAPPEEGGPASTALATLQEKRTANGRANEAILSDPDYQNIIRLFSQQKGVNLVSSPSVTTRMGQKAVVEIIREVRRPDEAGKGLNDDNFVGIQNSFEPVRTADGKKVQVSMTAKLRRLAGRSIAESNAIIKDGILPAGERVIASTTSSDIALADGETVCVDLGAGEDRCRLFLFVTSRLVKPAGAPTKLEDLERELNRQGTAGHEHPDTSRTQPVTVSGIALKLNLPEDNRKLQELFNLFMPPVSSGIEKVVPLSSALSAGTTLPPKTDNFVLLGVMTPEQTEILVKEIKKHAAVERLSRQVETTKVDRTDLPFDFKGTTHSSLIVSPVVGPEDFTLDVNIKSEASPGSGAITTSVTLWDKQTVIMGRVTPGADGGASTQASEVVLLTFESVK